MRVRVRASRAERGSSKVRGDREGGACGGLWGRGWRGRAWGGVWRGRTVDRSLLDFLAAAVGVLDQLVSCGRSESSVRVRVRERAKRSGVWRGRRMQGEAGECAASGARAGRGLGEVVAPKAPWLWDAAGCEQGAAHPSSMSRSPCALPYRCFSAKRGWPQEPPTTVTR